MEPHTGELIRMSDALKKLSNDFQRVPPELSRAASKKLAGRDHAEMSLTSGGKLSKWAAKQRKTKRKRAAASRRKNR